MTPADILAENARRLALINAPYDPVAGDPDDPDRVEYSVKGLHS